MRNILVFPDGTEHPFMYPDNREVTVGERLQVQLQDNVVHVLEIKSISKTDREIRYHLSLA